MPQLVVVDGPSLGERFLLSPNQVLGNLPDSDILIQDSRISGHQCRIHFQDGEYRIRSLSEQHAVLVNGVPTHDHALQHGDMVTLGKTMFLFDESDPETSGRETPRDPPSTMESQIQSRQTVFTDVRTLLKTFEQTDAASHRLGTLLKVGHAIGSILDPQEMLQNLLQLIFEEVAATRGLVLLRDEDRNKLKVTAHRHRDPSVQEPPRFSRTIVKQAVETQEALMSLDAEADDRFAGGLSIAEQRIKSVICTPLMNKDRVLGVLYLDTELQTGAFTEPDLELLRGIAMQAAIAIDNALVHQGRRRYSESLISLGKATQQLSSYLTRQPILSDAVQFGCRILGCTKSSVLLFSEQTGMLHLESAVGLPRERWNSVRLKPGEGFVGRVLQSGQPMLVRGRRDVPHGMPFPSRPRYETESFLIVPILSKAEERYGQIQTIGALCVTDKLNRSLFNDDDRELLSILAGQLGIAVDNADLYEKATVDSLTRTFVKRIFLQRLEEEVRRSLRYTIALSLLMLDLDHFKKVNDTYGHQAGDMVLREAGRRIRETCRTVDMPARYGGEEFAVICPNTRLEDAKILADRLREQFSSNPFPTGEADIPLTVSIGVAALTQGETAQRLVRRADRALYEAKNEGRDRVVIAPS